MTWMKFENVLYVDVLCVVCISFISNKFLGQEHSSFGCFVLFCCWFFFSSLEIRRFQGWLRWDHQLTHSESRGSLMRMQLHSWFVRSGKKGEFWARVCYDLYSFPQSIIAMRDKVRVAFFYFSPSLALVLDSEWR